MASSRRVARTCGFQARGFSSKSEKPQTAKTAACATNLTVAGKLTGPEIARKIKNPV